VVSRVKVAGYAFYTGRSEFIVEANDPFGGGFDLPGRIGELVGGVGGD
jgi:proline racemase